METTFRSSGLRDMRSCTIATCIFLSLSVVGLIIAVVLNKITIPPVIFTSAIFLISIPTHIVQYHLVKTKRYHFKVPSLLSVALSWNNALVILFLMTLISVLVMFTVYPLTFHLVEGSLLKDFMLFMSYIIPIVLSLCLFSCTIDLQQRVRTLFPAVSKTTV